MKSLTEPEKVYDRSFIVYFLWPDSARQLLELGNKMMYNL